MDESRAALVVAYNAVRERHNKLRLQHRQSLRDRTCQHCRQRLGAAAGTQKGSDRQSTSVICQPSSDGACEVREICDQLDQMVKARQVPDSCSAIQDIASHLRSVAGRMVGNSGSAEQQESLSDASTAEESSLAVSSSCIQSQDLASDAGSIPVSNASVQSQEQSVTDTELLETSNHMAPPETSETHSDSDNLDKSLNGDVAPWLSDLHDVAEMATTQYTELKGVCSHLKQQNESLKRLVKQLICEKADHTPCDSGSMTYTDWSLIDK